MAKTPKNSGPGESLPSETEMRAFVQRFVEVVESNEPLKFYIKQMMEKEREQAAGRDAEARQLNELKSEEQRLTEQLAAVRAKIATSNAPVCDDDR